MNKLEIQSSTISKWVNSTSIHGGVLRSWDDAELIKQYVTRIDKTRYKIKSLMNALNESQNKGTLGRLVVSVSTDGVHEGLVDGKTMLEELYNALGLYLVQKWSGDLVRGFTFWTLFRGLETIEGKVWWDYLGDQSIRENGGRVVVMLSDEGVKRLNEIANKLYPFVSTSVV